MATQAIREPALGNESYFIWLRQLKPAQWQVAPAAKYRERGLVAALPRCGCRLRRIGAPTELQRSMVKAPGLASHASLLYTTPGRPREPAKR